MELSLLKWGKSQANHNRSPHPGGSARFHFLHGSSQTHRQGCPTPHSQSSGLLLLWGHLPPSVSDDYGPGGQHEGPTPWFFSPSAWSHTSTWREGIGKDWAQVSSSALHPECLHLWAETHLAARPPPLHKNLRIAGKCRKFQLSVVTTNKSGNNSSVDPRQTAPTEK